MVGQTLSHYRIVAKLGEGGMGEVYLAEDTRLGRRVALKLLPPHLTSDVTAKARFETEARAASSLDHPNICTIHDIEEAPDGRLMLAMGFCEGVSLKLRLTDGPLSAAEAVDIAAQIADGLAEAHARGIVHRDIKPANVMVTRTGRVRIVDFGIARVPDASAVTTTGGVVGTPAYMAPEQARGERVDARADLWALGVVLYEMLAGRAPFGGASVEETLYAVLHKAPEPVERLAAGLQPAVARIVGRALMKDPVGRYQQAERMLADLQACRQQLARSNEQPAPGAAGRRPSIAVLPFANLSADKEQDYFCDGMTEELTTALSGLERLRVVAHTSASQFKGQALDIRRVGEMLDVENIVEGSVRKVGNKLRLTAQLVNAADGYHLWAERYDRELDDVFAVQDEIARAIAGKLKIRLMGSTGALLVKRPTDNLEAYQLYLKGRYLNARRYTVGPEPAMKCYAQAVEAAPDFPAALAGLADCYTVTGLFSLAPIREMVPKAKAAIERALALDEACAEAHHALGALHVFLDWDWPTGERAMTRALELNPTLSITRAYYALGLAMMGHAGEAIREAETAISLDPFSAFVAYLAGGTYYILGMNPRAVDETRRAAELDPHMVLTSYLSAAALSKVGRHEEAIDTARRAVTLTGRSPFTVAVLATVLDAAGRGAESRALLDELSDRRQREFVADGVLAVALAAAGERDAALTALERAIAGHGGSFPWMLFVHAFDSIRRDPRFVKVLEHIGYTGTSAVLLGRED
jgi:eukaryotic-like serine/threonine-protein kinase